MGQSSVSSTHLTTSSEINDEQLLDFIYRLSYRNFLGVSLGSSNCSSAFSPLLPKCIKLTANLGVDQRKLIPSFMKQFSVIS